MAAHQTLDLWILVRIQAPQPEIFMEPDSTPSHKQSYTDEHLAGSGGADRSFMLLINPEGYTGILRGLKVE